jgi:hypothetical protein
MFQRVRIGGRVLPGNLLKIHSPDLPAPSQIADDYLATNLSGNGFWGLYQKAPLMLCVLPALNALNGAFNNTPKHVWNMTHYLYTRVLIRM